MKHAQKGRQVWLAIILDEINKWQLLHRVEGVERPHQFTIYH